MCRPGRRGMYSPTPGWEYAFTARSLVSLSYMISPIQMDTGTRPMVNNILMAAHLNSFYIGETGLPTCECIKDRSMDTIARI